MAARRRNKPAPAHRSEGPATVAVMALSQGAATWRRLDERLERHAQFRRNVLTMEQRAGEQFVMYGGWNDGILAEHYLFGEYYTMRWICSEWVGGGWGAERQEYSMERSCAAPCGSAARYGFFARTPRC